jgi:hypothetical protein
LGLFIYQTKFWLKFDQIWSHLTKFFAIIEPILCVKGSLQESILANFFMVSIVFSNLVAIIAKMFLR